MRWQGEKQINEIGIELKVEVKCRSTACFPHFFAFFPTLCSHLQARDIKIHSQYRLCTGDIKPSFKYHFLPPPSLHL